MTGAAVVDEARTSRIATQFAVLGCALLNDAAPEYTFQIDRPFQNRTPALILAGPVAPVATDDDMLPCLQLLEQAPAGHVLYIRNDSAERSEALAGDIYVSAMRSHGHLGLLVDGAVRDTRELTELGVPVFSTEVTFLSARTASVILDEVPAPLDVPVRRPGPALAAEGDAWARMRPGDWVFADADGVMLVPAERVSVVIAAALILHEREAALKQALAAGGRMGDLCGLQARLDGTGELRFSF